MPVINSLENKKIKELIRLKKAGVRRNQGLILIDGSREAAEAIKAGLEALELYYCPELMKAGQKKPGGGPETELSERVFQKLCYKEKPDGVLLLAKEPLRSLEDIILNPNPLVVVLEAVEKPGNLGAIIRTAAAVGADAVIINDQQTDIYNPNVIRASEGLVFQKTVVKAEREETIAWLKKNKIRSLAAATGNNQSYLEVDFKKPTAIILGSEAEGLSQEWLEKADKKISIPMEKRIDSLNVSVSAAILVYEARRQRKKA